MSAPDELTTPIHLPKAPAGRGAGLGRAVRIGSAIVVILAVVAGTAYVALHDDPLAGEPHAVVAIASPGGGQQTSAEGPAKPRGTAPNGARPASDVEQASGVTVTRGDGSASPGSLVIGVPSDAIKLNPAPDARLVEKSRFGPLPKIGEDGARAADVYARPAPADLAPGTPRVAILVSGLGISRSSTTDAIEQLPGAVTLAFAPYGAELDRQAAAARDAGHEIMMQAPMEPFDFPDSDPGPHTMLVKAKPADNLEKLMFVLSRFPGFIGVTNFMGAKLTADETAMRPILKEIAGRGLLFVDDGTAPKSVVASAAGSVGLAARKADVAIDAQASPEAIDGELMRLEALARTQGIAVGSASALPVTIDRLSKWAATLKAKGIALIPVSAAVKDGSATTQAAAAAR